MVGMVKNMGAIVSRPVRPRLGPDWLPKRGATAAAPARDNRPLMHLLIPYAVCSADACQQLLPTLHLPHLSALLQGLAPTALELGDDSDLALPHERALAQALGLPAGNGLTPWAALEAWEAASTASPASAAAEPPAWAFVWPCHWQLASDHCVLDEPDLLGLTEAESQTLLAAMAGYFAEDGITLEYASPQRWRARGEIFRGLATASIDRVRGRCLDPWLPQGRQAQPLRRLQSEMQMLLYTHPLNDARTDRGQTPVNGLWFSGSGALPADHGRQPRSAQHPALRLAEDLRAPALRADWPAWAQAWQQLDASACAALRTHWQQHGQATLTLCGERSAQRYTAQPRSRSQRALQYLRNLSGNRLHGIPSQL